MSSTRQLAAIMFTDIVGYTALMQENEQKAVSVIRHYNVALNKHVTEHNGKILNYYGDGSLCTFLSATDATTCAIELQKELQTDPAVPLRIGLHIGEIFFEEEKALGDGVNIASRIQSLAQANTILFSHEVFDKIKNNPGFKPVSLGLFDFKNVDEPMEVFALANTGFVVPKRAQMKGKLKQKKKLSLLLWITIICLLAGSGILISYFLKSKQVKSIAVLEFEDLSPGRGQEYLGDGIATSVRVLLSHLKDLKVIGRTSSKADLVNIGKSLDVEYVLEGTVQRIGDYIKITATLIKTIDGTQVWSELYNMGSGNLFNVQDKIAQSIVEKINVRMTGKEKQMLVSSNTTTALNYEDYLKGQYHLYKLTAAGIDSAAYYFNRVLQKDSNFAQAHAAIADLWVIKMQQGQIHFTEGKKRVEEAAQKAQKLDPNIAEVHYSLGFSAWIQWDWPALTKEFYEAIQIQPNHAKAHIYLSNFQYILGNTSESKFHSSKALELEPRDPLITSLYSMNLIYEGKVSMAVQILETNLKNFPGDDQTITTLRTAYHLTGQYDRAFETWRKYFSIKGDKVSDSILTTAYREAGYQNALQRLAEFYASRSNRSWLIATLYTRAELKEKAFEWLYKAFEEHDLNMPYLKVDPIFNFIKNDTRYKDLLRKINLQAG